jgi:hypothetical protein
MLSAVSIDGKRFFYCNPLRYSGNEYHLSRTDDIPSRWFKHNCFCCPPQVARSLAWMHQWAYSLSDNSVWVNIYSGNELNIKLNNGQVHLIQETNYPWDGNINFSFKKTPEKPFAMMLRIPDWLQGQEDQVSIKINGREKDLSINSGTFVEIKRQWTENDILEFILPIKAHLVQANPEVEEARNQVAIQRGPVVYCLESADLPKDIDVSQVYIPVDMTLAEKKQPELLGGTVTLVGKAIVMPKQDWNETLYQSLNAQTGKAVSIQMIPYYAWANRGVHQMTVWLPVLR